MTDHGGSLARARALFAHAPEPWIDLSTGISPHSYPLSDLPATALTRLPEPGRLAELSAVAAAAYGAPSALHVLPAPGTQILLPRVYSLAKPGRAVVLGPTYAEHARAAAVAGHSVTEASSIEALSDADLAIVVNPNNPDGRLVEPEALRQVAAGLRAGGGLLVVDEAFMDVGPAGGSMARHAGEGGLVVLRSFGKFFGLAGLRLGFAIADPDSVERLEAEFGPWAVAGPALEYGLAALADTGWQARARDHLARDAGRLDALLGAAGLAVSGGTSLYRFVIDHRAADLFLSLGERGILVRDFAARPDALRFGLPGDEPAWRRLDEALERWASGEADRNEQETKP